MDTDINRFRGKILGGFNRKDVSEYIEKLSEERNALRRRCRELEEQTAQLAQKSAQLQQQSARLQADAAELQERAERAEKELTFLKAKQGEELAAEKALRDQMREEMEKTLAAERENARRDAAAQVAAKLDEIGTLLDCLAEDSARDSQDARDRLEALCEGLDASAHATEEARRRYRALREELEQGAGAETAEPDAVPSEDACVEECASVEASGEETEEFPAEDPAPAPEQVTEEAAADLETAAEDFSVPAEPADPEENAPAAAEIPAVEDEARIWTGEIPAE